MNKWFIGILILALFQVEIVAQCDVYAQQKAKEKYQKALNASNTLEQLSFLQQSLDSCYSPEVEVQISLLKGDTAYDNQEYKKAKEYYNKMLELVDQIKDPAVRKELHLLSYQCLEDTYKAMNEYELASIMKQKYDMRKENDTQASNDVELVSSDMIVKALQLPKNFKGVGVTQSINLHVNYKYDSVEFTNEGEVQSKELAVALKELQIDYPGTKVEIIGYTDSRGSAVYNLDLSKRRAEALKQYLVTNFTFDQIGFSSTGHGESELICKEGHITHINGEYSCTGSEDNVQSRRVEVVFGY